MKTVKSIQKEIDRLSIQAEQLRDSPNKKDNTKGRAMIKRIVMLRELILYVESGVTEEFLKAEEARLSGLLDSINKAFNSPTGVSFSYVSHLRREHNKKNNVSTIKAQLDRVQYLLQD